MATSSFFRRIEIKMPKQARKLVEALEQSQKVHVGKNAVRSLVIEIKEEQVKTVLAKIKW